MRCGMTLYVQNYGDWDRYEALERGENAPPLDPQADVKRFSEEVDSALKIEDQGFDALWTVEHHISPYTMTTHPLELLSYFAGVTKKIDLGRWSSWCRDITRFGWLRKSRCCTI